MFVFDVYEHVAHRQAVSEKNTMNSTLNWTDKTKLA